MKKQNKETRKKMSYYKYLLGCI